MSPKFTFQHTATATLSSRYATEALIRVYNPSYTYKKAGVVVSDISPTGEIQRDMFAVRSDMDDHEKLMAAVGTINARYGKNTVRLACQQAKTWNMRQEHLSRRYTPRLDEVLEVA